MSASLRSGLLMAGGQGVPVGVASARQISALCQQDPEDDGCPRRGFRVARVYRHLACRTCAGEITLLGQQNSHLLCRMGRCIGVPRVHGLLQSGIRAAKIALLPKSLTELVRPGWPGFRMPGIRSDMESIHRTPHVTLFLQRHAQQRRSPGCDVVMTGGYGWQSRRRSPLKATGEHSATLG